MNPASHQSPPPLPIRSVRAEFQYTEGEAVRAAVVLTNELTPYMRFIPWFGAVMLLVMGSHAIFEGIHDTPKFPIVFGILMVSMPYFVRREAKKRFRQNPSAGNMISWNFAENQIENRTSGAQASFEWNKLILIKQLKDGFLLYPQPRAAHWIPKHSFRSKEDGTAFMQLIKNSGVRYKKS